MRHKKLTAAEEKRLTDAFVAQALAMGLEGNKKLPKDIKLQVRDRVLRAIPAETPQLDAIQKKLNDLQQTVTLMIDDKAAREAENRQRDEEREQLQTEISRLADALAQATTRKGWFSRNRHWR